MKTTRKLRHISQSLSVLATMAISSSLLAGPAAPEPAGQQTGKDLAGDVSRYFGQRANFYRDNSRKLAKLDLDGDLNYDGTINNDDPADNGAFQQTPPGLVVGKGEMSKVVIRLTP